MKRPNVKEPGRRISVLQLIMTVAITGSLVVGALIGHQWWISSAKVKSAEPNTGRVVPKGRSVEQPETGLAEPKAGSAEPWFAGYVDVTATPTYTFESRAAEGSRDVVLSGIVSAPDGSCTPMWGGAFTLQQAASSLDLDRRIARLLQRGGKMAVSFGGQFHDELATACMDVNELAAAYAKVIDRYHVSTIDLDVEGTNLSDRAAGQRRAQAVQKLQLQRRTTGKSLAIWLTLPVSPNGLTDDGKAAVDAMLRNGVDLTGVNAMTMDYSGSRAADQSMLNATTAALTATQLQLKALYSSAGVKLSAAAVWSKIGATPMIGQNDKPGEVFSLEAAKSLNQFVIGHGIGRISMWSLNRDKTCGPSHVAVQRASETCSGVRQDDREFADRMSADLAGRL
jgi:chitinase